MNLISTANFEDPYRTPSKLGQTVGNPDKLQLKTKTNRESYNYTIHN